MEARDRSGARPPTSDVACIAYVGMGSNLGDRESMLREAVAALDDHAGVRVVRVSTVYETDPVGPPPQGPYLNAAVEIESLLAPRELLEVLLEIERAQGRVRAGRPRHSARTLDLDLLLYGSERIDEPASPTKSAAAEAEADRALPALQVPHPRLHERDFVLEPLAELAGEQLHPVLGRSIDELARELRGTPGGSAPRPHARIEWVDDPV